MNGSRGWVLVVWGLPLSGAIAAVVVSTVSFTGVDAVLTVAPARPIAVEVPYQADSLGRRTIERDPFRTARGSADIAYDPQRSGSAGATVAAAPKPTLVLTGIVWGASPEAVLEGLPGVEGARVLRAGDALGGLSVKRIEPGRITVVGMDTVWVLTVRQPW